MSDGSPESPSASDSSNLPPPGSYPDGPWFATPTDASSAVPYAGPAQWPAAEPPRRTRRGPLIGLIAFAVAAALGWGVVHYLSGNNKPVATSAQAKSGGITVAGHGIKMTFPAGWINVPTSPNQFRQFIKDFENSGRHIPASLQAEINDPQMLQTFAMLVFRSSGPSGRPEDLDALVAPSKVTPSQMIAVLQSGQGPAQFGATDVHYSMTKFGNYPGLLVTYVLRVQNVTAYGAQSYLDGPTSMVVTTVTSGDAAASEADLIKIVDTIQFS